LRAEAGCTEAGNAESRIALGVPDLRELWILACARMPIRQRALAIAKGLDEALGTSRFFLACRTGWQTQFP
jgi:hypothetical protein